MSLKFFHNLLAAFVALICLFVVVLFVVIQRPIVEMIATAAYRVDPYSAETKQVETAFDESYQIAIKGDMPLDEEYLTKNEQSHLLDVYNYIKLIIPISFFCILFGITLFIFRKHFLFDLGWFYLMFTWIFVGMFAVLTLGVVFFTQFFALFHEVLFPQGNYAFGADSLLIQAFPYHFWMYMLALISGLMVIGWLGLFLYRRFVYERPGSARAVESSGDDD